MLNLPSVTLIAVDCLDAERAKNSIEKCLEVCNFGGVKLLTSKEIDYPYRVRIENLNSLLKYSEFMLNHVYKYCETTHMQIVQYDGWIINPLSWEDDWMRYDYVGAIYRDENPVNNNSVGNGGFSLRTRRLMKFVSENLGEFKPFWGWHAYMNEDGVICKGMKSLISQAGMNICPPERAAKYAFEGNPAYFYNKPFGFHGFHGLNILKEANK